MVWAAFAISRRSPGDLNADLNSFLVLMHRQLAQVGAPFDSTVIASNPPDGTLTASAQVICQTGQVSECNLRAQVPMPASDIGSLGPVNRPAIARSQDRGFESGGTNDHRSVQRQQTSAEKSRKRLVDLFRWRQSKGRRR